MSQKRQFYDDEEAEKFKIMKPIPIEKLDSSSPFTKAPESEVPPINANAFNIQAPILIQKQIKHIRYKLHDELTIFQNKYNDIKNEFIIFENNLIKKYRNLKNPNEDLLPANIYILTSILSGSIISKNRGILLRFSTPLIFGIISFKFLLPKTIYNIESKIWKFEIEKFPLKVVNSQVMIKNSVNDAKNWIYVTKKTNNEKLIESIKTSRLWLYKHAKNIEVELEEAKK